MDFGLGLWNEFEQLLQLQLLLALLLQLLIGGGIGGGKTTLYDVSYADNDEDANNVKLNISDSE